MCIFKEFNCDRLIKWINSKFSVEYFVAMLPSWMDLAMDNEWLPDQEVVWNKVPLEWPQRSKLNYPHPDWRNCWSTLLVELGEHLKKEWNISVEVRFIKWQILLLRYEDRLEYRFALTRQSWNLRYCNTRSRCLNCVLLALGFSPSNWEFFPFYS